MRSQLGDPLAQRHHAHTGLLIPFGVFALLAALICVLFTYL